MEWIQTNLVGIYFKCINNILTIKNENSGWCKVEYNDGSGWRYVFLPGLSDYSKEPVATCSPNIKWRFWQGIQSKQSLITTHNGMFSVEVKEISNVTSLPCDGNACGAVDANLLNEVGPNGGYIFSIRNIGQNRIKVAYKTYYYGCSGEYNVWLKAGETRRIELEPHQLGICNPINVNYE